MLIMEWILQSPQIQSTFGYLGYAFEDGYHGSENCNESLATILENILKEDKYLRTYRRSISLGQHIEKDLVPLLIHTKDEKTVELLINILVHLTTPIECLMSVDMITKSDFGKQIVFEINNLLASTKSAFMDNRTTKVIIDFLKKNSEPEQKGPLTPEQRTNVSNSLLLLRNILHISEDAKVPDTNNGETPRNLQNQILWNIFSQSIDKILIKLMTISDANYWAVIMVQLVALLYKDQHVANLQKLFNVWLETSLSESSEENESNTSLRPDRGSHDSSPILTSNPISELSDTGVPKNNRDPNANNGWDASKEKTSDIGDQTSVIKPPQPEKPEQAKKRDCHKNIIPDNHKISPPCSNMNTILETSAQIEIKENEESITEASACGYDQQIEKQKSILTSSNEDEPAKKPVHQKPPTNKQRIITRTRPYITLQERRRKKFAQRGKWNITNVQGLSHKTPTDEDISKILTEFTVDFVLKGYNALVQTLYTQIMSNVNLEIDSSHFFWLVNYFLKFVTQIELDLEHVSAVLSFDIMTYFTAVGVDICEQSELSIKVGGNDLKSHLGKLHLIVTAIREFVQAIETYKKFAHLTDDEREVLMKVQIKMCETEELRSLMVLLLRHYNPKYHSKLYLQDLVVTNHTLLMFITSITALPYYNGTANIVEHIRQFASPDVMSQYGLLLEDYTSNGEFLNDCIFTLMHHVGGGDGSPISMFQPKILKTFASICQTEFVVCEDWSDLIKYVLNTFVTFPSKFRLMTEHFDDDKIFQKPLIKVSKRKPKKKSVGTGVKHTTHERWTEEEISFLNWNYMQHNALPDVVGEIAKLFKTDGIIKSRTSVIQELHKQNLISDGEFELMSQAEINKINRKIPVVPEMRNEEIKQLCVHMKQDGKAMFLDWVQRTLLEACFAKIYVEKNSLRVQTPEVQTEVKPVKFNFELFKKKLNELPVVSPVSYQSLIYNQSIPLVPWNSDQAFICKDLKFLQLLHKLGFHMPVDTGKVFIRIPEFWTADMLYQVAGKIKPIDTTKLHFSVKEVSQWSGQALPQRSTSAAKNLIQEKFYKTQNHKHLAAMVNFTPITGSSYRLESVIPSPKHNWLEMVQKSHISKINLNMKNTTGLEENDDALSDFIIQAPPINRILIQPMKLDPGDLPLELPAIITTEQDTPLDKVMPDFECNISLCDTASVASDLTRMYVSDEDEDDGPEVLFRPVVLSTIPLLKHGILEDDSDAIAIKRPRMEFLQPLTAMK